MKGFLKEFKEFLNRGNVMDMAVGIIIGGAFTAIVNSLVEDMINPLLGLFGGMNLDKFSITLLGEATLNYGKFLSAILNFIIMALVVFCLIKALNVFSRKKDVVEEATEKECPYCKSRIAIGATRCPHCTSELPKDE
ncbi:MAG: large conductance mechanosensitive channel protein MscL [Lachnospiraceae bacterium]|nr:large conductance mechanosensitive channel protein MscL [Lachnospiraceae bacterium]